MKLYPKSMRSLTKTERPFHILVSLPMPFAEAHRTEGGFRRLKSTLNNLKS